MNDTRILITDGLDEIGLAILRASAIVQDSSGISAEELVKILPEYDAVILRGRTKFTPELIRASKRLKVIGRAGVGVDNIELRAAKDQKIIVVNAPLSTSTAVAELTFGLLLALSREIPRADSSMKHGQWLKKELEGTELMGKTLGIIGIGRIGMEVGQRALAFGMNVIAYDPFIEEREIDQRGAQPVSIQDLFAWSDFISLHLPRNVETRDLVGDQAFSEMKQGVRIVNAARGGIIDERALLDALKSGKVAAAALDVFSSEPPTMDELIQHPRVIATPHIGAQTAEAQARASKDIAEEVLAALHGEPLRWRVA
jgi:D-3-phosphoglycerate dehydrogenase